MFFIATNWNNCDVYCKHIITAIIRWPMFNEFHQMSTLKLWIWSQSWPPLIKVFCSSTCQGQRMGVNWQTCLLLSLHFTRCQPAILCYASISSTLRKYFSFNSKTYLLFSQFTSHATELLQWHKYLTHNMSHMLLIACTSSCNALKIFPAWSFCSKRSFTLKKIVATV